MASSHPLFTTRLEQAALALANEFGTSRINIPTDEMGHPLSAGDVAHMLLHLPRQVSTVKSLVQLLDTRYHNIPIEMVSRWRMLRQQLEATEGDDDTAEKENAPPPPFAKLDDDVPTRTAEGGPASADSHSPPLTPIPPTPNPPRSVPASPLLGSILRPAHIAPTPHPSSQAPAPSDSMVTFPLPAGILDDNLSDGDVVAVSSQDLEAASERDVEEVEGLAADCSTPDDDPGYPSMQDEENQSSNTTSSPSLVASPSSPSSPTRSSTFARNPPSPTLHARLVRSNGVSNFQDLKLVSTSQEAATSDVDFFSTPPINAINALPPFNPVPPPAVHSITNSGDYDLQSPTPASGTGPRGQSRQGREEEEVIVDGAEQDETQDEVLGDNTVSSSVAVTTPSTSNRRKRAREDDEEREDNRPPANRAPRDNLPLRLWRRVKQYFW